MPQNTYRSWLLILTGLLSGAWNTALAQPADYFNGKTITVYIAFGPGGGYDQYARLFVRHAGKHIPGNPTVVASNMPGASGVVASNFLYNVAPKDGTALGFLYQTIAQDQILGGQNIQYDAARFSWIGRITSTVEVMYTWHAVPIRTAQDLTKRETIFAVGGPLIATYAHLLTTVMGARFKLVRGYPSTPEIHLAMQRGEVEGAYSSLSTLRSSWSEWLADKSVNIIVQSMLERHPDLPEVPTVVELGKTTEDKQVLAFFAAGGEIGRAAVAPPDIPADRLRMLRAAFQDTVKDPQFIAEARQLKMDVEPLAGEGLRAISERIVSIDGAATERIRSMAK